jgi:predicted RNA methylase
MYCAIGYAGNARATIARNPPFGPQVHHRSDLNRSANSRPPVAETPW